MAKSRKQFQKPITQAVVKANRTKARLYQIGGASAVCLAAACLVVWFVYQRQPARVGQMMDHAAQSNYLSGDEADAEQKWLQAIQEDPTYFPVYMHLGGAYLRSSRPRQAAQCFTAATLLEPKNGLAWLHLAQAQLTENDVDSAVTSAGTAVNLSPNNAEAFTVQGQVQERESNIAAAIAAFRRALALAPGDHTATIELARTEITYHQMGQAEQDFLPYLRSHLQDPEACFLLAGYYGELAPTPQNLQQALTYARLARAQAPDNPNAVLEAADVELALGRTQDALADYLAAQQLDARQQEPPSSRVLSGLMRCYLRLHNPQAASLVSARLAQVEQRDDLIQHDTDALRFDPANPQIADTLGTLEEENGDMRSAESYYALAVQRSPQSQSARAQLAAFYRRRGQLDQAAQAMNPKFIP